MWLTQTIARVCMVTCALLQASCLQTGHVEAESARYLLAVVDDKGEPISAARVELNGAEYGVTSSQGRLPVRVRQSQGASQELSVSCPTKQNRVTRSLRAQNSLKKETEALSIKMVCDRGERILGIVVATKIANVQILLDGEGAGVTDAEGYAHLVTRSEPGFVHEIKLSAPKKTRAKTPKSTRVVTTLDRDAIYLVEHTFAQRKRKLRRRKPKKERPMPMRAIP